MEKCNCDCHKNDALSSLRSCKEQNKLKERKIKALEKKVVTLTVAVAIVATVVGKETLDATLDWLETFNKTKSRVVDVIGKEPLDYTIPQNYVYYGASPAPSALPLFALAMLPCKRRR